MNQEKFSRRTAAAVFGFALLGPGGGEEGGHPAARTVWWRLERAGVISWLFGTIHAPHPRFQPLPAVVAQALRNSQQVFTEIALDEMAQAEMSRAMRLPSGLNLRETVGEERYERMLRVSAAAGQPIAAAELDGLHPWAAALLFSQPREAMSPPLDVLLYQEGRQAGVPTAGLELPDEQAAIFAAFPDELQLAMLDAAMASAEDGFPEYRRLLDAYLEQDLMGLMREMSEQLDDALPTENRTEFVAALLLDRNHRFRERLLPMMTERSCFVALGAAHLFGPDGMLALFAQSGCEVTPMPFSFAKQ